MASEENDKSERSHAGRLKKMASATSNAAHFLARRKFLTFALGNTALAGALLTMGRDQLHEHVMEWEKVYYAYTGFPAIEPDTIPSRPFIHKRFCEMKEKAGLEGLTLCVSKEGRGMAVSVGKIPWITCIGNKVVVSQMMLNIFPDREMVAILGHELAHIKHYFRHSATADIPEIASLSAAAVTGAAMLVAEHGQDVKNHPSQEKKPRVFSRRNMLRAGAVALVSAGAVEGALSQNTLAKQAIHNVEYEADYEGMLLCEDKTATISALRGMQALMMKVGIVEDGSGSHPTCADRIKKLNHYPVNDLHVQAR